MKIPTYARYDLCVKRACDFLEEYNITSYPVDVEKIISKQKWGLTPYSLLMKEFNCDRETVIRCLRSKDGYTQLDNYNYSIAYNDDPKLGERKRFTLMHEIGHIYLNHLKDFDITLLYRGSLSQEENRVLENEANAFARNVLVPTSMYLGLKDKSTSNVARHFGISLSAAQARIDFIYTDQNSFRNLNLSQKIRLVYYKFIQKRRCLVCNTQLFKEVTFCPICGSKNSLKWGDGNMNYKKYLTNNDGSLEECIRCNNEEIIGSFCHICGAPTRNFCSDYYSAIDDYNTCHHSEPLPGNARFCPDCGSESTFYKHKILPSWETERDELIAKEGTDAEEQTYLFQPSLLDNILDNVFDDDEKLPFN